MKSHFKFSVLMNIIINCAANEYNLCYYFDVYDFNCFCRRVIHDFCMSPI